jgi:hypothetical protein
MATTPVERGCGSRQEGGIYIECGLSEWGEPLEKFILDPPVPVPVEFKLPTQGVGSFERNGIFHAADRIGAKFYPNAADFTEEVRRFGLSRRIPKNFPFEILSERSKIFVAHPKGLVTNWAGLRTNSPVYPSWICPKCKVEHKPAELLGALSAIRDKEEADAFAARNCCAGVWFETLLGGDEIALAAQTPGYNRRSRTQWDGNPLDTLSNRLVVRKMPSFEYVGFKAPRGFEPNFVEAFIASFPISNLCVIRARDNSHIEAIDRAKAASLPVEVADN